MRKEFEGFKESMKLFIDHTKSEVDLIHVKINDQIHDVLSKKVDFDDFKKALENKANKHSVATALHRKANKQEVAEELKKILRTNEFDQILQLIENKASIDDFERIEAMFDDKVTHEDLAKFKQDFEGKVDRDELENIIVGIIQTEQSNSEKAILETKSLFAKYRDNLIEELDLIKQDLHHKLELKVDTNQCMELTTKLSKKADMERVTSLVAQSKNSVIDILETYKKEFNNIKNEMKGKFEIKDKYYRCEL